MTLKPEIEPATEPVAEVATLMPQSESINISITSASTSDIYQVGEEIFLTIKSDASGFVNCYLEGKDGFMRIFPNRFTPDGFVSSEGAVTLPDSTGYSITADLDGETIHCIVTTRSVYTELPGALKLADFEMLSISSKSEIIDAYEKVTAGHYGEASYTIRLQ